MNTIYPLGLPIALSLTAYNAFLTGLFVLLKRRDRGGFHYFIVSFVIFLWGMGLSFMLNNDLSETVAKDWGRFSQIAAVLIPATWLHFVLVYTNQVGYFKKVLFAVYFFTLAILPFALTPYFILGFRTIVGIKVYPIPGLAYVAFTLLFVLTICFSFWIFLKGIQKASSMEKKKDYKIVCFASLYGYLTGSLSFLPVYGIVFPQYNLLAMPLWQILLAYGMIRHHIFDLEEILYAARKDKMAAIGTLATSINHEIRNPLYIIKGMSESHLANFGESVYSNQEQALRKANEILGKTAVQAARAMDIMKRFAMFAKQDVKQDPQIEPVNLNQILSVVLPLVNHELELDKIELIQNIPQDLPAVKTDRRHLEEILFNLVVNACQAIKDPRPLKDCFAVRECGGDNKGRIEITAAQQNSYVNILIKDNGPGIEAGQLQKIFDPFYTTKEQGTGLGLYVTRQLVEKNKGKISATSKPGQGTEFLIRFPCTFEGATFLPRETRKQDFVPIHIPIP